VTETTLDDFRAYFTSGVVAPGAYYLLAFLPALRFLTGPFPPGAFAARFFAAVIFPPLLLVLFFAMEPESHERSRISVQLRTTASCDRDSYRANSCRIHQSTCFSRTKSGIDPTESTASWNRRMSNRDPSCFVAFSRSRTNVCRPMR